MTHATLVVRPILLALCLLALVLAAPLASAEESENSAIEGGKMSSVAPCSIGLQGGVAISEIRIDMPGTDTDEYCEICAEPGMALTDLTYIVIGDGPGGPTECGIIENVTDLSGLVVRPNGLLAIGDLETSGMHTLPPGSYDVELDLNFENSDNVTHMIVSSFSGALGDDLDEDDDGVLDETPWGLIFDSVGLDEGTTPNCDPDDFLYSSDTVGPDGGFVPGHVFKCEGVWFIGPFDLLAGLDTPGEPNACPIPVENTTWGSVKATYR